MKYYLFIILLLSSFILGDTTANVGLTLVDDDITLNTKITHSAEKGNWQTNYQTNYIYKRVDGKEKVNDLYFQVKQNYKLTDKSYALGVVQLDYDKLRPNYTLRTVLGAGYGYKLLKTDNWKISNEVSLAYLNSSSNELIVRNSLWISYIFSEKFNITNKLLYESGKDMYLKNETSLMYKLTDKVSLGVSNTYTDSVETKNIFNLNVGVKL